MPLRMKPLIAIALAFVLTACHATQPEKSANSEALTVPPQTEAPAETDTCGAKTYAWLVGQNRDRIPPAAPGTVVRVLCSTCPMTMDFNASRLTIIYDEKTGTVSKLSCG